MMYADKIGPLMRRIAAAFLAAVLGVQAAVALEPHADPAPTSFGVASAAMTDEEFLDRLMLAESAGRDDAKNPLSTATGPYQFINATFLELARRYFPAETATLTVPQILALRTDRTYARRAAALYTVENARHLTAAGLPVTYPHLRLAFLVGPVGAVKVLQAPGESTVASLLGAPVIRANPFMRGLTAASVVARSARDLKLAPGDAGGVASGSPAAPRPMLATVIAPPFEVRSATEQAAAPKKPAAPKIAVRCNLELASCRKWVALQTKVAKAREAPPKRIKAAALR